MGISIGLIGLGNFGRSFAPLFKAHPLVDRVGLCDREPDRVARFAEDPFFADKFSPSDAYASRDEILGADFDALVLITQPWLHAPQATAVLESGKCVYSAVPVMCVPDADEILDWCDKLVQAVQATGRHYMMGETTFYRPETMYCRRRAAAGDFGGFVHADGDYMHAFNLPGCDLRDVNRSRMDSAAGREWAQRMPEYAARGVRGGPMHYPTHSTAGPISVMGAHMTKVSCIGTPPKSTDPYFSGGDDDNAFGECFSNETALFTMSNGATCRIREYREIGYGGYEGFRIFGTKGSFLEKQWVDQTSKTDLTVDQMRDPLPEAVYDAFSAAGATDVYGGHGGSHAYLVNEFVDAVAADRVPTVNIWEAARYMAPGATAHKSALADGEWLDVPDWGDAPK